uniref:Uncharacterized protein AlNc14C406G11414 n=1 Tax=Albugo laibachii Nc14 TaxID=890382 RepID=F0WZ05_9STRA|nr:conserved hypothetical protein [Albugo laibachii Nc14]|eukprot:CCA26719.1 conserved hypothetical protein [Albugo laibachii Nc14]
MFLTAISGSTQVSLYPKAHRGISSDQMVQVATINTQHWLFIPGSYFLVLTPSNQLDVLYFCFVDASNLHSVRQALETDAVVHASTPLQNAQDVQERIVILHRGQTPFLDKVWHAQQAGAFGVVNIDTGGVCTGTFDGNCVLGSSKALGNGFGHTDRHDRWYEIWIPYILITNAAAASLLPGCDALSHSAKVARYVTLAFMQTFIWTREEHAQFIQTLELYGGESSAAEWQRMQNLIPTRSMDEIKLYAAHYLHHLLRIQTASSKTSSQGSFPLSYRSHGLTPKPCILSPLTSSWTFEDDKKLETAISECKKKDKSVQWTRIASALPEKSGKELRQRFDNLVHDVVQIERGVGIASMPGNRVNVAAKMKRESSDGPVSSKPLEYSIALLPSPIQHDVRRGSLPHSENKSSEAELWTHETENEKLVPKTLTPCGPFTPRFWKDFVLSEEFRMLVCPNTAETEPSMIQTSHHNVKNFSF